MSSNPFAKTNLRASTIVFCYTKVNLIDAPTLSSKIHAPRRLQIGLTFILHPSITTGRFTMRHLILLVKPLTADSINQGIKFIACWISCSQCMSWVPLWHRAKQCVWFLQGWHLQNAIAGTTASLASAEEKNRSELSINDVIKSLSQLSSAQRLAFSNVWVLMKILLVMPATSDSSERSFSGLRRIKTYLRTTMTQKRLNDLMVLNIYKEKTDLLNLAVVAK